MVSVDIDTGGAGAGVAGAGGAGAGAGAGGAGATGVAVLEPAAIVAPAKRVLDLMVDNGWIGKNRLTSESCNATASWGLKP